MGNDSHVTCYGESGKERDSKTLENLEKYGDTVESSEGKDDGTYTMYCFRPKKKDYFKDKKKGADKGWNIIYWWKYKNARFKVVIKSLGAILGITIGGIIYYYVTNTRNQLVPVMSEGGGGGAKLYEYGFNCGIIFRGNA